MLRFLPKSFIILLSFITVAVGFSAAWGTQIFVQAMETHSGQKIDVPVIVDRVENLAGIKIVMKYDQKLLTYVSGTKTAHSDSLLHIVNSKKPGLLIIVMAGARGIKGENFSILQLTFETKKGLKEKTITYIEITELEMMSDKLKAIQGDIHVSPITILP